MSNCIKPVLANVLHTNMCIDDDIYDKKTNMCCDKYYRKNIIPIYDTTVLTMF